MTSRVHPGVKMTEINGEWHHEENQGTAKRPARPTRTTTTTTMMHDDVNSNERESHVLPCGYPHLSKGPDSEVLLQDVLSDLNWCRLHCDLSGDKGWCSAVRCSAVQCGAVQCGAVRCGSVPGLTLLPCCVFQMPGWELLEKIKPCCVFLLPFRLSCCCCAPFCCGCACPFLVLSILLALRWAAQSAVSCVSYLASCLLRGVYSALSCVLVCFAAL